MNEDFCFHTLQFQGNEKAKRPIPVVIQSKACTGFNSLETAIMASSPTWDNNAVYPRRLSVCSLQGRYSARDEPIPPQEVPTYVYK